MRISSRTSRSILVGLMALALALPGGAWAESADGLDAATGQVKAGASQIGAGQIWDGAGEMTKGVGNTIVEGSKATGRQLSRAGQITGYGIQTGWNTSFDAVVDATDATVGFFKRLADF
ncbi:MAG TPA: hypothetical protein VIX40_12620 [Methylomirabilota bacterium]|jgi:hypothetical protein